MIHFLIPARGGSKRLKRKNILTIAGKPMIQWSIEAVKRSRYFSDNLYVSSEDPEIIEFCKKHVMVIERPAYLAEDQVWTQDVIDHFVSEIKAKDDDTIVLIQANSPEMDEKKIDEAISKYLDEGLWEVHSVDDNLVNNGAIHVMKASIGNNKGKANYNGFIYANFTDIHSMEDFMRAEEKLELKRLVKEVKENGASFMPNFLPDEKVNEIRKGIEKTVKTAKKFDSRYIYPTEIPFPKKFINKMPIINYRGGHHDNGMIDFIGVDRLSNSFKVFRDDPRIKFLVEELSMKYNKKFRILRCHSYINNGVSDTRGYHRDNKTPGVQFKIFMYLTDVESIELGPYAFMLNDKEERVFLSKKGGLIMSDQNGLHRGFPQSKDSYRVLAVINITAE